jgi:hypothetical protein
MTNKPQQPEPMAPPPLINKDDLLGPSKPVFKSASIAIFEFNEVHDHTKITEAIMVVIIW